MLLYKEKHMDMGGEKHRGVVALYLRVRLAEGFCEKMKNK